VKIFWWFPYVGGQVVGVENFDPELGYGLRACFLVSPEFLFFFGSEGTFLFAEGKLKLKSFGRPRKSNKSTVTFSINSFLFFVTVPEISENIFFSIQNMLYKVNSIWCRDHEAAEKKIKKQRLRKRISIIHLAKVFSSNGNFQHPNGSLCVL